MAHSRAAAYPVPSRFLKRGKQRISFQLTGRGTYSYQCLLEGFVAAERLTSSTNAWNIAGTVAFRMAEYALNEGGPTLPIASLETTSELAPYGFATGTVLGTVSPNFTPIDGELEAIGAFGEITTP